MSTKSRESIYSASIRASAERAKEARKKADQLACEAWNPRTLGCKGPAQPSPALGDAINAGDCSQVRGYAYKLSHLVALRLTKISANDPPSTWWPGER
jgi:hypothetical protein